MNRAELPVARGLITLEGGEGVGKTTALKIICDILAAHGQPYITTREPGGTKVGEELRSILLSKREDRLAPETELLMMFAARAQHMAEFVHPALDAGKFVVCDRFTDSSYAYQAAGRGLHRGYIEVLEQKFVGVRPELTLLLDAPVEVSRIRTASRDDVPDRIESEADIFFERVRTGFLDLASDEPDRFRIIDTDKTYRSVMDDIHTVVERHLQSRLPAAA